MKKLLLSLVTAIFFVPAMLAQEEVTVTLKFVSPTLTENIYEKVITTTEPFSGKFLSSVKVDSDEYTFQCEPAVGLNFEPADDYIIYSLSTDVTDPSVQNIQGGKYQRSITLLPGIPENVTIFIEVAEEGYTGVAGIINNSETGPVYNLLGVKVADSIESMRAANLHKGIYIVNGRKVVVK